MTDIKANMRNKHLNVTCVACQTENIINEETQEHILNCKVILSKLKKTNSSEESFKEIFTNKNYT